MPSSEEITWAIATIARREKVLWRFRLILLGLPVGAGGTAVAASELRMEELFWLGGVLGVMLLVAAVGVLSTGPPAADVARAWAILRAVIQDRGSSP